MTEEGLTYRIYYLFEFYTSFCIICL